MDTERGWQVVKRESDGDLFLAKVGATEDVAAVWGPLIPVTDFKMFDRPDDFTTLERLPELEHAGSGNANPGGGTFTRTGGTAA